MIGCPLRAATERERRGGGRAPARGRGRGTGAAWGTAGREGKKARREGGGTRPAKHSAGRSDRQTESSEGRRTQARDLSFPACRFSMPRPPPRLWKANVDLPPKARRYMTKSLTAWQRASAMEGCRRYPTQANEQRASAASELLNTRGSLKECRNRSPCPVRVEEWRQTRSDSRGLAPIPKRG